MKLGDYLTPERVIADLDAQTKPEVLAELVSPLQAAGLDTVRARTALLDREQLGTTGIGDGVAIPHGKIESLTEIILVVGRSRKGVDFEALDFKPCRIFFLVLAPEQAAGLHLRILAHISRLLRDEAFRAAFLNAPDRDSLWNMLKNL
jgi:PTS system nitrogen regulatory IIA component